MIRNRLFGVFFGLFVCYLLTAQVNPVEVSINWKKSIGRLTADHWGINDSGNGFNFYNQAMADFFSQYKPGVVRIHHANLVQKLVNTSTQHWDTVKIRSMFENLTKTYKHDGRIMFTFDNCPDFISKTLPLTVDQEDKLAHFFAQFPVIIKKMGYRVDLYEFLNEKEGLYSKDYNAYWRLLNKIAVAMKTADPTVKCGGTAMNYPTSDVYRGYIDNCHMNMDFVSCHMYARGAPGKIPNSYDDVFTGKRAYRNQSLNAAGISKYLKSKKLKNMEVILDEFNVQYVWTPYEPMHHNFRGASWMACFVKNVALQGVNVMNIWNADDGGSYGIIGENYFSAPANLYLLSNPYLRGKILQSDDSTNQVEIIPIRNANGSKSSLFVNRTANTVDLINLNKVMQVRKMAELVGFRLDSTTRVLNDNIYPTYRIDTINSVTPVIKLNPWGMLLLTNNVKGIDNQNRDSELQKSNRKLNKKINTK